MNLYLKWIRDLEENQKQEEAFERQDSTVVIAGPGSGKTRVLALKAAQLLREEIKQPRGIACLTYTRMMARELKRRLYSLGVSKRPNVFVGTVHGFSLGEVVLPFKDLYDIGLPEVIRIAPRPIQASCFHQAAAEVLGDGYDPNNSWDVGNIFNKCRRQRADVPFSQWEDHHDIGEAIEVYEQRLLDLGYVDFDIIIHAALRLIIDQDVVRKSLYGRFPWFAVDEYQDLGYPLNRIVIELIDQTPVKLFAIGDPDQSIFDFAGTDPIYLKELSERPDMKPVIRLKKNYRSKREIVTVAQVLLGASRNNYSDDVGGRCLVLECCNGITHQAEVAVKLVKRYQELGIPSDNIAVLHRWRSSGIERIAEIFEKHEIDFVLDKHPLYDRTMELIKWLEDLGYWCLKGWRQEAEGRYDLDDLLAVWQQIGFGSRLGFDEETNCARVYLVEVLWNLRDSNQLLGPWLADIAESLDLQASLREYRDTHPDEVEEFKRLYELTSPGSELEGLSLTEFVNLDPGVQLTTLHSSKGTEFEAVIIAGIETIGSGSNDRRLLYVGATRARRELCLLYTKSCPPWQTRLVTPHCVRRLMSSMKAQDWQFVTHKSL